MEDVEKKKGISLLKCTLQGLVLVYQYSSLVFFSKTIKIALTMEINISSCKEIRYDINAYLQPKLFGQP